MYILKDQSKRKGTSFVGLITREHSRLDSSRLCDGHSYFYLSSVTHFITTVAVCFRIVALMENQISSKFLISS